MDLSVDDAYKFLTAALFKDDKDLVVEVDLEDLKSLHGKRLTIRQSSVGPTILVFLEDSPQ